MTEKSQKFVAGAAAAKPRRKPAPKAAAKPKAKRARPTAKEASKGRRRRRVDSDPAMEGPLAVVREHFDPAYEYRWANNTPERIAKLTKQDDWDLVENTEKNFSSTGEDNYVRRPSGANGMVLVRKPKEYYDEDQARKIAKARGTDRLLRAGKAGNELGADGYVPNSGISMGEAR